MPDSREWPELRTWRYRDGENIFVVAPDHAGPKASSTTETQTYVPLQTIRERLEAEAEKLERPNKLGEDFTAATVRKVKAQGIRDALDAAFPPSKEETEK